MITVFKLSHFNSIILDDDTLKEEIESCRKDFNDQYNPLRLWINQSENNLVFYKRYYNSLASEYYYRFKIKIEDRFPANKKSVKFPKVYWYNNHGFIEKLTFDEISKKYYKYLENKWKQSTNLKWTNRWNNYKEVLEFIKGDKNDN